VSFILGGAALLLLPKASPVSAQKTLNEPAPELVGTSWLNTPDGKPLTLASRRGKVTIVHFWTFGCINCKRNLPSYERWQRRYRKYDVEIIGVHTPETPGERSEATVAAQVKKLGITYPILIDSKSENWKRWRQEWWPTVYLIDKAGRVRYGWAGELDYKGASGEAKMIRLIDALRKERIGEREGKASG
jgi:thiol-disulfide isomerase/thioredoxin